MDIVCSRRISCNGKNMQMVVLHLFIPSRVNNVEKWLEKMAIDGWELIRLRGWRFFFKKSKPQKRIYLMCTNFDKSKGISTDYYHVKEKYGKSKSILNKSDSEIFEADESKIDHDFFFFRRMRNDFYKKHYFQFAVFSFGSLLLSLSFLQHILLFFAISVPILCAFVYSMVSLFLISKSDAVLENR